jgi:hypothetical protein
VALPRTFVSFSSTDISHYHMMCAWKANEHIDFDFADFQLNSAIQSENENYIKRICREKIRLTDTFVLLIGADTYTKSTFVKWEVEVAIEKGCRLIGVNINNCRVRDWLCPYFYVDKGALFVSFSARIVAEALNRGGPPEKSGNFHFADDVYTKLGYKLIGSTAVLPPRPNPFDMGNRPPWAK